MAAVVALRGVEKRYGDTLAVAGVDLEIAAGETFALVGESGCGKTTTLRLINRLVEATAGEVEVLGEDVRSVAPPALRRRIGYVIQDGGLFAHLSVRHNVGVVPKLLGWSAHRIGARVEELLDLVGLPDHEFGNRFPRHLSGGQRQRVGIARALAADPPLVLLDEPFGALDPITRGRMQDEFIALSERVEKTFVLVTHDVFEAVRLADRIGVMLRGKLVRCGTPREVVRDPEHPFVEELIGRYRFQLRLMTTPLSDVVRAGAAESDAEATLDEHATVWEALSQCERDGQSSVVVATNTGFRRLTRAHLVAAASD